MGKFQLISPKEISGNPFDMFADQWALFTAGEGLNDYNTMTVSWGGAGILWKKNVATVYIRPQRYTYEFIEKSQHFTLSFFDEKYHKALSFCGSKSGRDFDKAKECGLTPIVLDGGVTFEEAKLVLVCKKLYFCDIDPKNIMDPQIDAENYSNKDYHRVYIGEIMNAYQK